MTGLRGTERAGRQSRIGTAGTCARIVVGLACLGTVAGHQLAGFKPAPLALGIVGFPVVLLA